jgi:hypothetical protein
VLPPAGAEGLPPRAPAARRHKLYGGVAGLLLLLLRRRRRLLLLLLLLRRRRLRRLLRLKTTHCHCGAQAGLEGRYG